MGKVVECEHAVVKDTFKVVVVYRATPADCQAFYYAKVFFLKDLVEHSREEFPLLLLPGVPTSATSKRQMRHLKWYQCPKPWIIFIAASSIGFAWHWIMAGPWEQHYRLLWFWMGNTAVGLVLGYWRALDQNRILLDGGACGIPVDLIPWLSLEMQHVDGTEEKEDETIVGKDTKNSVPPPVTERLIPLASDDYRTTAHALQNDKEEQAPATNEEPQQDAPNKSIAWYQAWLKNRAHNVKKEWSNEMIAAPQEEGEDEEQALLLNDATPVQDSWLDEDDLQEEKQPSVDDLPVDSWPNKRSIRRDDAIVQQEQFLLADPPRDVVKEYWPNQHSTEEAATATAAAEKMTTANTDQSFENELDLILMDATAEDTWAQQNLDTATESELSLWDRLEKDYRGWLKAVHRMTPERFNEMSLADRLQLRGSYYNAEDAKDENARRILIDLRAKREKRKLTKRTEEPKFMDSPLAAAEAWLAQHAPQSVTSSSQQSSFSQQAQHAPQSVSSSSRQSSSSQQTSSSLWDKLDKDYRNWLKSSHGLTPQAFNDMTTADRLQLRASYYNTDSTTSSSSLWGKLDKDYRKWLKSSHGITSDTFNDMTTADRLQLRTSYYNADTTSSSSSLWDKLDADYRKWLKSSQGITSQNFNDMTAADRLQLRTRYYSANSVTSSLWDKLERDYRKWLQSTHGISPQKFNAMSTASRLQLRTSYYNVVDNDGTDDGDKSKQIVDDLRSKREESRKRRQDEKSKRPRRSRIANF
eukprot:scaffold17318_cov169-Amphora_coffeaeformis.AAC.1